MLIANVPFIHSLGRAKASSPSNATSTSYASSTLKSSGDLSRLVVRTGDVLAFLLVPGTFFLPPLLPVTPRYIQKNDGVRLSPDYGGLWVPSYSWFSCQTLVDVVLVYVSERSWGYHGDLCVVVAQMVTGLIPPGHLPHQTPTTLALGLPAASITKTVPLLVPHTTQDEKSSFGTLQDLPDPRNSPQAWSVATFQWQVGQSHWQWVPTALFFILPDSMLYKTTHQVRRHSL
ncbi:hypothetical protein FA13DRAFT_665486 [Coprinellus micaceus]|uniref:Uncharacterized protein n=1 Tax=Coprinellus micaceus TaxID=71717 RepID=A0A4Y7T4V0_COPMI|nr:hypothetical protein FA13DRAFT_665486 [Coprinellus micaceus]